MNSQAPTARPYCPGVRVGNWFEDVALEEDIVRDFVNKRDSGKLMYQMNNFIRDLVQEKVELSVSRDGRVHFGDVVMIINPQTLDCKRCAHALCFTLNDDAVHNAKESVCSETLDVMASATAIKPTARSAFVIKSCDGSHEGEPLRYNQPFYLSTADGQKYLTSDRATFMVAAQKSRHQKVWFGQHLSHLAEWRILPFDPKFRLELEYTPVPANSTIIINHIKTNQNLNLENFLLHTYFGKEREVACNTEYNSHRAEQDTNHWMLTESIPGSDVLGVVPANIDNPSCPNLG